MEKQKLRKIPSSVQFGWNENLFEAVEDELDIQKNELLSIKKDPLYHTARTILLPYTNLKSRFHYQDALKLAEMDILFKVCPRSPVVPYVPSLLGYTSPIRINTIDLGGGPGAFVEYIQFRYVNAMTVGMTKRISVNNMGWNLEKLDPSRLLRFEGSNFSGDLTTQWKSFIKYMESHFAGGLDFVCSSAWDDEDKKMDWIAFLEFYLTIKTIKEGANSIIRMKATWSKLMLETIYLASLTFEDVYLFQPLISGSDSDEIYLVLIEAQSEKEDYLHLIHLLLERIPPMDEIQGVLSSPLPEEFLDQMEGIRNIFMNEQIQTLKLIRNYLWINDTNETLPSIDISLKLAEWALPDAY